MKKLIPHLLALAALTAGCHASVSMGEKEEAMSRYIHAFEKSDTSGLSGFLTPGFVDHTGGGTVKSRDTLKQNILVGATQVKDLQIKLLQQSTRNDYGFAWYELSGRLAGADTASKPFVLHSSQVFRFEGDLIAEHWEYSDPFEREQLVTAP